MQVPSPSPDRLFTQRNTSLPEVLHPFGKDMFHGGPEELMGLSSLRAGFVNIIEASVQSRVRNAKIAGSLLDVWFDAILLLPQKLRTCALDLFFDIVG
jgi:hypothetical protein